MWNPESASDAVYRVRAVYGRCPDLGKLNVQFRVPSFNYSAGTYDVEFDDGDVAELTANVIAQNMYANVDNDGQHVLMLDAIIDHERLETASRKFFCELRIEYLSIQK